MRIATACVCCGNENLKKSPAILMPFIAHRVFDWRPFEVDDSQGLKTIKDGTAYSICNSVLCSDCFHLFLDIRFNADEMGRLYEGYRASSYVSLREKYEPGYAKRNKQLGNGYNYTSDVENFIKPFLGDSLNSLKILDWGGDTGKNTPFRDNCDLVHIYDVSEVPISGKAERVSKNEICRNSYSLIICSHVLEHIPYPQTILHDIRLVMNESSLLYLEVPFENLVRKTKNKATVHEMKKHWHEHINFFNHKALEALLFKSNLRILKLGTLRISGESSDYVFQACCSLRGSGKL